MDAKLLNGNTLAYIGDAVFSLQIRTYLVNKNLQKSNELQRQTVKYVKAKSQAEFIHAMIAAGLLTDSELEIVKRGRNAKSSSVAKNASITDYRAATGFEALWGYLYLENEKDRLKKLLEFVVAEGEQ